MGAAPARKPAALTVIAGGRAAAPAGDGDGAVARAGYGRAAAEYAAAARAPATTRAYASDWHAWEAHCAAVGVAPAAAHAGHLADYLAQKARAGDAVATIERRAAGIRDGYRQRGWPAPEAAADVVRGIKREHAAPPRRARPLVADDMRAIFDAFPARRALSDHRDAALLALGWQAALRRSEIVGLDWSDYGEGLASIVTLRRTKGERTGASATVPLIGARLPAACPVRALAALGHAYGQHDRDWRERPMFRRLTPRGALTDARLTAQSVNLIVRRRAAAAGLPAEGLSAHSLRSGFLSSAAHAGATTWRLMEHSRHKRSSTLDSYVREARRLADHPAKGLI